MNMPTDEDYPPNPHIETIGANLMAMVAVRDACRALGWHSDYLICAGIVMELATLVEGESLSNSETYRIASQLAGRPDEPEEPEEP